MTLNIIQKLEKKPCEYNEIIFPDGRDNSYLNHTLYAHLILGPVPGYLQFELTRKLSLNRLFRNIQQQYILAHKVAPTPAYWPLNMLRHHGHVRNAYELAIKAERMPISLSERQSRAGCVLGAGRRFGFRCGIADKHFKTQERKKKN